MNIGTSAQYPDFMVIKLDTIELCSEISGKKLPLTTLNSILTQSLWGVRPFSHRSLWWYS